MFAEQKSERWESNMGECYIALFTTIKSSANKRVLLFLYENKATTAFFIRIIFYFFFFFFNK